MSENDTSATGTEHVECPECGGSGFVTGDTGPGEAECLNEDCPTDVFEVRDDGLRADGGEVEPVGNRLRENLDDECRHCGKPKDDAEEIVPVSRGRWSIGPEWGCGEYHDDVRILTDDGQPSTGTVRKRCRECTLLEAPRFTLDSDDDYVAVLHHFLDEHPRSDTFRDVIESTWIETVCSECEQPFFAPMKLGQDGLHCETYCPECEAEDWIRPLFVRAVEPEELVEWQANPSEDELTRSVAPEPAGSDGGDRRD